MVKPSFHPSDHTADEVTAHLATADEDERRRVVRLEVRGRNRAEVLDDWWSYREQVDEPDTP